MEIKKILWPTDFSEYSNVPLAYVISLSKKYNAEIHLLYVAQDLSDIGTWYGEITPEHAQKLRQWELPEAEKKLDKICTSKLAGCPMFHKHVLVGDPARKILETAEKEGVDVIVMATRGRGGEFPFGSVTEKVIKSSSIPVWTVRPTKPKS